MRIGGLIGVVVGAACIGFGLSNIWTRREGVSAQGRKVIIGVPILLGLAIAGGSAVIAWSPQGRRVLAGAPGRDLEYEGGTLIDTSVVAGIAGAPSYVARFYGTNDSDETAVAKVASPLGGLGFGRVPEKPGPIFRPGDGRQLAAFANGRIMVRVHALTLPRRIGGRLITGFRQIVVVVVSDDGAKPT